eukprot:jgi/Tetstr1/423413/TSEL_014094.t1
MLRFVPFAVSEFGSLAPHAEAFLGEGTGAVLSWLAGLDLRGQALSTAERQQYEELELLGQAMGAEEAAAALAAAALGAPEGAAAGPGTEDAEEGGEGGGGGRGRDPLDVEGSAAWRAAEELALAEELEALRRQSALLAHQRTALREAGAAARRREAGAAARRAAAGGAIASAEAAVLGASRQLEGLLEGLAADSAQLAALYTASGDFLLCSSPVGGYARADLSFSTELDRFRTKQFAAGAAALEAEAAEALLEAPGKAAAQGLLGGQEQAEWAAMQKELGRLKHAYKVGEQQRVLALAEQAGAEAELAELQAALGGGRAPRLGAAEAEAEAAALGRQRAELAAALPTLLRKIAATQDLAVMRADYERKLLRQGYYFERKKAFLGHMLRQASWHKMLELCLAIEAQGTARLRDLLVSTEQRLADSAAASAGRVTAYRQLRPAPRADRRLTLRAGDQLLRRLWAALRPAECLRAGGRGGAAEAEGLAAGTPGSAALSAEYVEVDALLALVGALRELEATGVASAAAATRQAQRGALGAVRAACAQLDGVAFAAAGAGEPALAPPGLQAALRALKSVCNSLNEAVVQLGGQYAAKAEQLKRQGEAGALARMTLPLFHTDPARLATEARRLEGLAGWGA